jgi:hypothetical protein
MTDHAFDSVRILDASGLPSGSDDDSKSRIGDDVREPEIPHAETVARPEKLSGESFPKVLDTSEG